MEISKEKLEEINRAREQLLRKLETDPKFKEQCEKDYERMYGHISNTKQKQPSAERNTEQP